MESGKAQESASREWAGNGGLARAEWVGGVHLVLAKAHEKKAQSKAARVAGERLETYGRKL